MSADVEAVSAPPVARLAAPPGLHLAGIRALLPGLGLAAAAAAAAFAARGIPPLASFSPLILGIIIGMLLGNLAGVPAWAKPGLAFSMRRVLRLGIVLLGFQITIGQIAEVGLAGLSVLAATLAATFLFTVQIGRLMGVDAKLAQLIAAGTSICGASAVIATNEVTRGRDEDVAYAVASVTVFGSIAMLVYPLLPGILGLGPQAYGFWAGASIHEVAQVVAAAYQHGDIAGEAAAVAKLSRVVMLAPVVIALGFFAVRRRRTDGAAWTAPAPPYFVLGFAATMLASSSGLIPAGMRADSALVTQALLATALAAMGMETSFRRLAGKGMRPLALGAAASLFISLFSLALVIAVRMI